MDLPLPVTNGQVTEYSAVQPPNSTPRIYYVNGIQNDAQDHAHTAYHLSQITEHVVFGVFNRTAGKGAGIIIDLLQCGADWMDIFLSKLAELGNRGATALVDKLGGLVGSGPDVRPGVNPDSVAERIRQKIPVARRVAFIEDCLATYNRATASLFQQLRTHPAEKQIIIAHSQGNLITADALWSMVLAYGELSLANMQVYSLASPSPAWPLGIRYRRKVYGHTNDLVTLFDPHNLTFTRTAGDWRLFGTSPIPGLAGHKVERNIALNFHNTIRRDLGLSPLAEAGSIPVQVAAASTPGSMRTYTVKPGDTLSQIARSIYGHGGNWQRIYDANRMTIGPNPNLIRPGQTLLIP